MTQSPFMWPAPAVRIVCMVSLGAVLASAIPASHAASLISGPRIEQSQRSILGVRGAVANVCSAVFSSADTACEPTVE